MKSTILKVAISAVVLTVLSQGLWILIRILGSSVFVDSRYWCTWSSFASSFSMNAPSAVFLYWTVAINLVCAIIFTILYRVMSNKFLGGSWKKGLKYSSLALLAGGLPVFAMGAFMIHLSPALIAVAIISTVIITLINGVIVAVINRY